VRVLGSRSPARGRRSRVGAVKPRYSRYIALGVLLMIVGLGAAIFLLAHRGSANAAEVPTEVQVAGSGTTGVSDAGSGTTLGLHTSSTKANVSSSTTRNVPTATTAKTTPTKDANGLTLVKVAQLPPEAQHTVALIDKGGPFPYERDGIVFQNREGVLAKRAAGYYHEYTVITPGSADRGARRVITGSAGERYYTADHYATFVRVEATS